MPDDRTEKLERGRLPSSVGPYRVTGTLGEGGMGVVLAARDERLARDVAIKVISRSNRDPAARERLRREARALAGLRHPNVCQIFDIGETDGDPYIVMELLRGETLSSKLLRGPLLPQEATEIAITVLSALQALHANGVIHRDLKPSNIFLTDAGLKLLDFGLARSENADGSLTNTGAIVGTPLYMSTEQVLGLPIDARTDIFSAGVVLFHMLSGKPPFEHAQVAALLHAIAYDQAPALSGSPAVEALDRVIRRAMAKRADDRYPSAQAMIDDLRSTSSLIHSGATVQRRATTRLAILPFRLLRPDPEYEFLAHSLPDSIGASLARFESLVVRSAQSAARWAGDVLDVNAIASGLDVDAVITGTLLRSGDGLRFHTQLVEVPSGAVLWSQRAQVTIHDVFQVEDDVTHRVVDALSLPLTEREHRMLQRDVPANSRAYEFYLRAARQGHSPDDWVIARDLYRRAVEEDPHYAPAWARLARAELLVNKYTSSSDTDLAHAESTVRRALSLSPDLPIAQRVYAQIELEMGRSAEALKRLRSASAARPADPELQAAIVHAARYCGQLDESIAAHRRARDLDPTIITSVTHSYFMKGDYERALASFERDIGYIDALSLVMLGRQDEALQRLLERESHATDRKYLLWLAHLRYAIEGNRERAMETLRELQATLRDPEANYYLGRFAAWLGEPADALRILEGVVANGFFCLPAFESDPWLDSLRGESRFVTLLEDVRRKSLLSA